MPPDLRSAATGDIDSTMLQTSTNRLLLQSWLPDGGSTHVLAQRSPAHGAQSSARGGAALAGHRATLTLPCNARSARAAAAAVNARRLLRG